MKATSKTKPNVRLTARRNGNIAAVRTGEASLPTNRQIRSILVPIDFSPPSKEALKAAAGFARQFGAKLTLLNVVAPVATPDFAYHPLMMENDKIMAQSKRELERVPKTEDVDSELVEKVLVRYGVPYREITDAARTLKVDLIIIATHGYSGLAHVFMGSTAERVVRHAECPVLVVRGRKEKSNERAN
ncbi:MAG TPA: universal stress protein [Verrucomicrobiae bacterium]